MATSSERSLRYIMSCILPERVSGYEGRHGLFLVLLSLILRVIGAGSASGLEVEFVGGDVPLP